MDDDLYREVTDFAHDTPGWLHTAAEIGTDGGLILLAGLLAVAFFRARRAGARALAVALIAPAAVVVAYGVSELVKVLVEEQRPCRAVEGAAPTIAPCPGPGDWSFPSNHATIAVAAGTAVLLVWRGAAWLAVPVALLTAFSRVFLGVHYVHDVVAGGLLGAGLVIVATLLLATPGTRLIQRRQGRGQHGRYGPGAPGYTPAGHGQDAATGGPAVTHPGAGVGEMPPAPYHAPAGSPPQPDPQPPSQPTRPAS